MVNPFSRNPWTARREWIDPSSGNGPPKPKLAAPVITVIQDTDNSANIEIFFPLIPNAGRYQVYINSQLVGNTFSSPFQYVIPKNGDFLINVRAIDPTGNYAPSPFSNTEEVNVTQYETYLGFGSTFILANMQKILISN